MRFQSVYGCRFARLAGVSALALSAAACAGDSNRFAENPFSNPFRGATASSVDPAPTGSIAQRPPAAPSAPVPNAPVASAPLPPPSVPSGAPTPSPAPVVAQSQNIVNRAGAGTNAAVTGYNAEGWTTVGGSPVVLAQGETVNALANRYGVPAEAIYRSNRIANGSVVAPGTRLTIPIYRGAGASPAAAPARPAPKPAASAPARPAAPKVAVGPAKPAEPAKVAASRPEPAKPAPAKPEPKVAAPAKPEKPAAPKIADAKQPKPEPAKPAARPASAKPEPAKPAQAKAEPAKPAARVADARPAPAAAPAAPPANETKVTRNEKPEPQTTGSVAANSPDFRWPARGRIISGFRNNGNDGINIAVPEGTPVKAADEGTVAYAGSELKGYGNLVLVRHANGYVSAYAHNGDLKVRKGDSVKRGQTIATSGQSGNVASPQLHFEIRRGSTPVDPSTYLQN